MKLVFWAFNDKLFALNQSARFANSELIVFTSAWASLFMGAGRGVQVGARAPPSFWKKGNGEKKSFNNKKKREKIVFILNF